MNNAFVLLLEDSLPRPRADVPRSRRCQRTRVASVTTTALSSPRRGSCRAWRDNQFADAAQPSLQWLESRTPSIVAAGIQTERTLFRMYVPNNAGDLVTADWERGNIDSSMAKHRIEKDIRPTRLLGGDFVHVHYLWEIPDPSTSEVDDYLNALGTAARSITHLGWGIDMVAANASVISAEDAAKLPGDRWQPVDGQLATGYRVPICGTLNALIHRHAAFLKRIFRDEGGKESFNPVPPLTAFRVVGFRRATDPVPRPFAVFELRDDDGDFFQYPQSRFIHIAGMVRHLAIEAMKHSPPRGVDSDWVETYVAGHGRAGGKEHRQFSYLPLPSIGHAHTDPGVRRVMISAPVGDDHLLRHFTKLLSGRQLQPTPETKLDHPPMLVNERNDNVAKFYTQPACSWASVTPVILPGHNDHKPIKTLKLIEKALAQSGIELPCEFEMERVLTVPQVTLSA